MPQSILNSTPCQNGTEPSQDNPADLACLNYAFGVPDCQALYKVIPEDFVVEEQIAFELSGEGEHLWCWVEKRGENTDWVLQQLAKWASVSPSKIGVAGQKDRHAVTRQWFSIQLPGLVNPKVDEFRLNNVTILKTTRHQRKLQTGGLSGNRFTVTLRNITCNAAETDVIETLQARLQKIQAEGVPNYFGEQRFGIHGRNIKQGEKLLVGELPKVKRNQKSMYLSAIRSWMFNCLLNERIKQGSWNRLLPGDILQLEGSNKWFVDDQSEGLSERVMVQDIHPTGALFGKGDLPTKMVAREIEDAVGDGFKSWVSGLVEYGVDQDRRALRLLPKDFEWQWVMDSSEEDEALHEAFSVLEVDGWKAAPVLRLSFSLRSGSYATMVMRELIQGSDYQAVLKDRQRVHS
ncbi:MAG: tRNA pseudouridine(13) synthase TruD [Gammaproteobacteria bacterium]|nr:tRNA pseudouridine(13) synthase TruD [Gammaproteobacteria bacterium]